MGKYTRIVWRLAIIAILSLTLAGAFVGQAGAMQVLKGLDLSGSINRVFFLGDGGYYGNLHVNSGQFPGLFVDGLQVGDYFQQVGYGLELALPKRAGRQFTIELGQDQYRLLQARNFLWRLGVRGEFTLACANLSLGVNLMLDDLTGKYLTYQAEFHFPKSKLKGNIGIGNLLGSDDGYAIWTGLAF